MIFDIHARHRMKNWIKERWCFFTGGHLWLPVKTETTAFLLDYTVTAWSGCPRCGTHRYVAVRYGGGKASQDYSRDAAVHSLRIDLELTARRGWKVG